MCLGFAAEQEWWDVPGSQPCLWLDLRLRKMPKMPSHLATLPAFPFLPPPMHPVMSDNNRLNRKEKRNQKKNNKGVKGPVCEGTWKQPEEMDTGETTSALAAKSLLIHTSPQPLREGKAKESGGKRPN